MIGCCVLTACATNDVSKQHRKANKQLLLDAMAWPKKTNKISGDSKLIEPEIQDSLNIEVSEAPAQKKAKRNSFGEGFFVPNSQDDLKFDTDLKFNSLLNGGSSLQDAIGFSSEVLEAEAAIFEIEKEKSIVETGLGIQSSGSVQVGSQSIQNNVDGLFSSITNEKLLADGGYIKSRIKTADKAIDIAHAEYLRTIDEVIFRAVNEYLNYELQIKTKLLINDNIEIAKPILDNLRKLESVGQIESTKISSAKQIYSNLKSAETETALNLTVSEFNLLDIFGIKADKIKLDPSRVSQSIKKNESFKTKTGVDVKIAQLNVELATDQLSEHSASNWGALSGRLVLDVPMSAGSAVPDASVGFVFSKTINDSGRYIQTKKKLEANFNRKKNFLRTSIDAEMLQKKVLLEKLESLKQTFIIRRDLIETLEVKISRLQRQMNIGSTEFGELLQAYLQLFEINRELINLENEVKLTQLQFLKVTGQLRSVFSLSEVLDRRNF